LQAGDAARGKGTGAMLPISVTGVRPTVINADVDGAPAGWRETRQRRKRSLGTRSEKGNRWAEPDLAWI